MKGEHSTELGRVISSGGLAMSAADPLAALARLENLEAYVASLELGAEAGLERLQGKEDPDAIRRRISILVDAGRFQEAADLIRGQPAHARWAEKAVYALVQSGEPGAAKELLRWSRSQETLLARRCALNYAAALLDHCRRLR